MKKNFKAEENGHYVNMTVKQPTVVNESSKNMASDEMLCKSDDRDNYHDCDDYNTEFCRLRCEFGPKEEDIPDTECGIYDSGTGVILQKIDSFDFDYSRDDGK